MTKNLSAIKRDQIALRNNLNNKNYKSSVKTLFKKALADINKMDTLVDDQGTSLISKVYSKIDKAVKKGVIPKNSGARKKSILANKLKNAIKKQKVDSNNQ